MARVKKQVKKRAKQLQPDYKGMTKEEKKTAKKEFDEAIKKFKKSAKWKKRKKRFFLLSFCICFIVTRKQFFSKASKKYKRRELGRR